MPWLDAAWQTPRWFDDSTLPFDVADRGLLLGDGVFDTALVLGGRVVWREAHVSRLLDACERLNFPVDPQRIDVAIDQTLSRTDDGSLRLTVTRGTGPRGLLPPQEAHPTVLATSAPMRPGVLFAPMRLHVSVIRRNDTSPLSRVKSLNYGDAVLAMAEAFEAGHSDALFLNTRGQVACTATGNIAAVIGSKLVTPPAHDGVLAGVVRGNLFHHAEQIGMSAQEGSLTLADLARADAVICTNSLRLVAPVEAVGGLTLASGPNRDALVQKLIRLVTELAEADADADLARFIA